MKKSNLKVDSKGQVMVMHGSESHAIGVPCKICKEAASKLNKVGKETVTVFINKKKEKHGK